MRTNIVFRHINVDRGLKNWLLDQVEWLGKNYRDLISISVVVDKISDAQRLCHIHLRCKRNVFNIKRTGHSELAAAVDAFEEVERELIKLDRKHRTEILHMNYREAMLSTTRKAWLGI